MKIERLTREELINKLVDGDIKLIEEAQAFNDYSYINDIMRGGFKGWDNFDDDELIREYKETQDFINSGNEFEFIPEDVDDDTLVFSGITEEELKNIRGERRLTSMQWWNNLPRVSQQMHIDEKYAGRLSALLTPEEIEEMYYNQD